MSSSRGEIHTDLSRAEQWLLAAQRRVGARGVVVGITLFSVVASLVGVLILLAVTDGFAERDVYLPSLVAGAVIPAMVAPPASILAVRLITRLDVAGARLREAAHTDHLTGVLNRRGFFGAIEAWAEATSATLGAGPAVVGMVDLDRFKELNDRYGHELGDRALIVLAAELRANLGAEAIIGRIGGDEFAFVVPGTADPDGLTGWGRALEAARGVPFSATIGATVMRNDETIDLALSRADAALYAVKRTPSPT